MKRPMYKKEVLAIDADLVCKSIAIQIDAQEPIKRIWLIVDSVGGENVLTDLNEECPLLPTSPAMAWEHYGKTIYERSLKSECLRQSYALTFTELQTDLTASYPILASTTE